jgi:hypothetical protein
VRHRLVVGYQILKELICPVFEGSISSALAVTKRQYTNISLHHTTKACPRYVGAKCRLNIRRQFKPITYCGLAHDWRTVLRARTQIAGCFRINYFTCENLSLPASYFQLLSCTSYRRFCQRRTAIRKRSYKVIILYYNTIVLL